MEEGGGKGEAWRDGRMEMEGKERKGKERKEGEVEKHLIVDKIITSLSSLSYITSSTYSSMVCSALCKTGS